jgi:hypothetical protein
MRGIKGWRQKARREEHSTAEAATEESSSPSTASRRPRLVAASTVRTALIAEAEHTNKSMECMSIESVLCWELARRAAPELALLRIAVCVSRLTG